MAQSIRYNPSGNIACARCDRMAVVLCSIDHYLSFEELRCGLLQEVSTMIRVGVNPIIFLLNNSSYAIEEMIHPGPYNKLSNWDYTGLVTAMSAGSPNLFTAKASTHYKTSSRF